jgi:hypothetical protein
LVLFQPWALIAGSPPGIRLRFNHIIFLPAETGGVRSFARLRMTGKILSFRNKLFCGLLFRFLLNAMDRGHFGLQLLSCSWQRIRRLSFLFKVCCHRQQLMRVLFERANACISLLGFMGFAAFSHL